jgi:aminoglycoside/choline kinase family phosphotransferase
MSSGIGIWYLRTVLKGLQLRLDQLKTWLSTADALPGGTLTLASGDASFRRYFRLQSDVGSFILMDAPPEKEDSLPFVRVAGYLEAMQLNSPRVIDADLEQGFLRLTDLGNTQYLEALQADPDCAASLYTDAIQALATMQRKGTAYQALLPPYDEELLRFELALFHDWLCGTCLRIEFSDADEASWQATCEMLVRNALEQPQVFVHRDYHSRNLMVDETHNPGILDFQDAVEGPLTYDIVSLLKDCYVKWPADQVQAWALEFRALLPKALRQQVDEAQFLRQFELMGVQRHLKAAGIFARLKLRDGKSGYMRDIPRALSYITDIAPRYEALQPLHELLQSRVLPGLEALV